MFFFALAFVGGVLTILSPCILPVLPFVFARADRPFVKNGLPLLAGMALTFTLVASLASYGGAWVVGANAFGRYFALVLLTIFGICLLWENVAELLSRPFVRLGNRLANAPLGGSQSAQSLVLGIATGLLWAPCAGPILGLLLAGAALKGASVGTTLAIFFYALGSAASLAVALLAGDRVFAFLKRSLGFEAGLRRLLGVATLAGVAMIVFGLDRRVFSNPSLQSDTAIEQRLVDAFTPKRSHLADVGVAPDFSGAVLWLNSKPLTREDLRGKVVLVDFWTYSCINCLRTLPYVRAWDAKYRSRGLVVIGVHTPEFAFEREAANVKRALIELNITYPVAIDNHNAIWNAFHNEYWPADYFIDAKGRLRSHHFGEGGYEEAERTIQDLLIERGGQPVRADALRVRGTGAQAPSDAQEMESPETYLGYGRAQNFASPQRVIAAGKQRYTVPERLALNQWGLAGRWTVNEEQVILDDAPGTITLRFHARDVHLVLGSETPGKAIRLRVLLDGRAPGADAGVDLDAAGWGTVREHRLYQLIRQKHPILDRTVEIQFLDPGVAGYAFTFG